MNIPQNFFKKVRMNYEHHVNIVCAKEIFIHASNYSFIFSSSSSWDNFFSEPALFFSRHC